MTGVGDAVRYVGVVPLETRDGLPLSALHGEPLFLHAVRTLLASPAVREVVVTVDEAVAAQARQALAGAGLGVEVVDAGGWWASWAAATTAPDVVLVDPLCPLVPGEFVAQALAQARPGRSVAGYRPVTDTVKTVVEDRIVGTVDRDRLAVIASPVTVPGRLAVDGPPPVEDFSRLAEWLRERGPLELVKAPSMARRVADEHALQVLECLDELGPTVEES